jgi:hypothetical protein
LQGQSTKKPLKWPIFFPIIVLMTKIVFASTQGFGEQDFSARLILAPKHGLANTKKRALLSGQLSLQRCGYFMTKSQFEALAAPLIQKENTDSFAVKFLNISAGRSCKLVLGKIFKYNEWNEGMRLNYLSILPWSTFPKQWLDSRRSYRRISQEIYSKRRRFPCNDCA